MKVNLDVSSFWKGYISIPKVEKKYNVKFVCESPIRDKYGWRESPSLIFYGEKHPQGSNYMALSIVYYHDDEGTLVVSDGISATKDTFTGIVDDDEVIYSRYRHDYRVGKTGVFIDGGRDYIRSSGGQFVQMKIIEDKLEVVQYLNDGVYEYEESV